MSTDKPMTSREIAERVLELRLVTTRGRTPAQTLTAQLYLELKRPNPRVHRIYTPGMGRAARGSVRWVRA